MGLFAKDYLIRLLEQLSERMAAIRGAIGAGESRGALAQIADAQQPNQSAVG
jgi:hypothetical protein